MNKLLASCLVFSLLTALSAAPATIYFKSASGQWQPLPAQSDSARGLLTFSLDPAQLKGGATMVILDLPPGIDLNDEQAPQVLGLKLDGRPLKDAPRLDLDWLPTHPRSLVLGIADRANPLDPASLSVRVNSQPLAPEQIRLKLDAGGRSGRLELALDSLLNAQNRFVNTIEVRLADLSPQRNELSRTFVYRCLGEVTDRPTLVAESSYAGYEKLEVLTDGKLISPGQTTYGSTWASEEVPGDHWIVCAWPQERELTGVEVSWTVYEGVYHAPLELRVQTWENDRWVTVTTLKKLAATKTTTLHFPARRTTRLRLLQPDGQGNPVRPNIMWLTELKPLP